MFESDREESRQLRAGIAVAPELSPKVASQKGAHGHNQIPGCAGASASAADDGHELQGMRGRLDPGPGRSGHLMQDSWMQKG